MQEKKHPNLVQLGEQIRTLRANAGYSQDDFALETGLDRSYYSSIERGERNVAAINLIKIAKALKVEVGKLFPPIKELS